MGNLAFRGAIISVSTGTATVANGTLTLVFNPPNTFTPTVEIDTDGLVKSDASGWNFNIAGSLLGMWLVTLQVRWMPTTAGTAGSEIRATIRDDAANIRGQMIEGYVVNSTNHQTVSALLYLTSGITLRAFVRQATGVVQSLQALSTEKIYFACVFLGS